MDILETILACIYTLGAVRPGAAIESKEMGIVT